jgi:hypothetical protein
MSSLAGSSEVVEVQTTPVSTPAPFAPLRLTQLLAASWGVCGVLLLLVQAISRLGALALQAHQMRLTAFQIGLSVVWVAVNAYAEGYRAFQRRFSPRVVVRALHLARNPSPLRVALAPLYCMAFFEATRRAKTIAWGTTVMVLCFILLLRQVPQPWRGIVDGGVVIALSWGALAILVMFLRAVLFGKVPPVSAELP